MTVNWDYDNVRNAVLRLVAEHAPVKDNSVAMDSHLVEDLGFYSVALLPLGLAVERTFNLSPITAADVAGVETPGQIVDFVCSRLRCGPEVASSHWTCSPRDPRM